MERHRDARCHRFAVPHRRFELPLPHGRPCRFVEGRPARLGDIDLADVAVGIHGDREHDIDVRVRWDRAGGVDRVDVRENDGSGYLGSGGGLSPRVACCEEGCEGAGEDDRTAVHRRGGRYNNV